MNAIGARIDQRRQALLQGHEPVGGKVALEDGILNTFAVVRQQARGLRAPAAARNVVSNDDFHAIVAGAWVALFR